MVIQYTAGSEVFCEGLKRSFSESHNRGDVRVSLSVIDEHRILSKWLSILTNFAFYHTGVCENVDGIESAK